MARRRRTAGEGEEREIIHYQVKRQDLRGKKILTVNEKYYIADHGIREAVYGGNRKDINLVLENICWLRRILSAGSLMLFPISVIIFQSTSSRWMNSCSVSILHEKSD